MVSWSVGETSGGGGFAYWRYPAGGQENNEDDFTFLGEFEGHGYFLSDYYDTWYNANDMLAEYNEAYLVAINTEEENNFLIDAFSDEVAWIGLHAPDYDWSMVDHWTSGDPIEYTNFASGEPNGSGDCGLTNFSEPGFWDDQPGDHGFRFIVEVVNEHEDGLVTGGVYDPEGNPVDSSYIYFFSEDAGYQAFSESGDYYSIELPPGHYSAYAYSSEIDWWFDFWDGGVFHLEEGSEMFMDFELYPRGEGEFGFAIAAVLGTEMAYVEIEDGDELYYSGYTNWWTYAGRALPPGEYNVHVWSEDQYQEQSVSVEADSLHWLYFDGGGGDEHGWIEGTVWNPDGNPIHDAHIFVWNYDHGFETWTNEDGHYWMEVPTGYYEMEAHADGHHSGWADTEVYPDETSYVDFMLSFDDDNNLLYNGGFEYFYSDDEWNDWQLFPEGWYHWPNYPPNNVHVEASGNYIHASDSIFWAWDGDHSLKMWGQYNGEPNETAVMQTYGPYWDYPIEPGTHFGVDAMIMSHQDDWIGQGSNTAWLFAMYFDSDWNFIGVDDSEVFSGDDEPTVWHHRHIEGVVPEGTEYVNIGIMFSQEDNNQHGAIYLDNMEAYVYDDEGQFVYLGEFEGHEYYLSPEGEEYLATWTEANDMIESWGEPFVHMATISSQEENDFINEASGFIETWIGFTDEDEEGNWQWVTGEDVVYTNWAGGEPNDAGGGEDWAHMWSDGTWNDHEQYVEFRFVVEVDDLASYAAPNILDVADVPDDQGGQVYITFERSIFDTDSIDNRDPELYTVERLDGDTWVGLGSIGAFASDVYVVEATTLADSTSESDAVMTYRIIANMEEGNYDSDPASGYSVDNIAPAVVAGLQANVSDGVVNLSWDLSEASDLLHYVVYRGNSPDFATDEGSMIGETTEPGFSDDVTELGDYYYVVTAVDIHENESDPSEAVNVTLLSLVDVHGLPEEYALHQNYPNPFNPTTTLRYDLPEDASVSVIIYDMMGRQVRTLVSGQASAGYHSTMWNATNDLGSSVSAGVYIYTIQAGQYRDVKKMVLLKQFYPFLQQQTPLSWGLLFVYVALDLYNDSW